MAFDIDANGILHVSAKDLSSGKEQKIRIEAQSGLKKEDIERMVRDAESHKEEDKKRKEQVEVKNEADALAFRAEKALKDYKDKIPQDVATDIQSKIDAVKKAIEKNVTEEIKAAMQDLNTHMQKIGEIMQKAGPQAQPGATPPPKEEKKENNIEEAEVEVLDDEEKKK